MGLVVKGCVPDGPPLQVAVFASVDVMKVLEDVKADDLDGPLAFLFCVWLAHTQHMRRC